MHSSSGGKRLPARELTIFSMLGSMMFLSRLFMEFAPNIHVLGLFMAAITLTYRKKALIPIYVFVLLDCVRWGFSIWWIPYLYIWLPLWGMFMLAGNFKLPIKVQIPLYMTLVALHGLSFGTLYTPAHALFCGLNFHAMIAWIIVGFPFDITHAIGNLAAGTLIVPLASLLQKLENPHIPK
jgi:energy-coupling factor transport system substrate-specific component